MVDLIGTKEMNKEIKELTSAMKEFQDVLSELNGKTGSLADTSDKIAQGLGQTNFTEMTAAMRDLKTDLKSMSADINGLSQEMTKEMRAMTTTIQSFGQTFETTMKVLIQSINNLGESMTTGVISNVRENLSIENLLSGLLKNKKAPNSNQ